MMRDDLVAEEIEIDPLLGAASLGTSENRTVKVPGGSEIIDRESEVKRAKHPLMIHPAAGAEAPPTPVPA